MTPEERFTKIENALQSLAERQAQHEELIAKNTAGIRDLVAVSRTIVDAQLRTNAQIEATGAQIKATDAQIKELREGQKETVEKLNALIETVDRIIRHQSGT